MGGFMKKICLAACAVLSLVVGGCSSTLEVPTLGADGRFASNATVDPENIQVTKAFDQTNWKKLVVVQEFTDNKQVNAFYFDSIGNSQKFEKVYDKASLETYVLANNFEGVTDASSLISLKNLSKTTGPFLLVRPYFVWNGGYNYDASLEAVDVQTGEVVFMANKGAFNWGGLDKPLFYPIFNAFMDWVDGKTMPNTDRVISLEEKLKIKKAKDEAEKAAGKAKNRN